MRRRKLQVIDDSTITHSSGNVFLDIGFEPGEAHKLLLQSDLFWRLEQMIRRRRLTKASSAKLFGVTRGQIGDLMRHKYDRFSIEMLIMMLARAGVMINFTIDSGKSGR